jgi:hypothetical protein
MAWLQDGVVIDSKSLTTFPIWRPEVDVCREKSEYKHELATRMVIFEPFDAKTQLTDKNSDCSIMSSQTDDR